MVAPKQQVNWTPRQLAILHAEYARQGASSALCAALKRGPKAVHDKARRLGLKLAGKPGKHLIGLHDRSDNGLPYDRRMACREPDHDEARRSRARQLALDLGPAGEGVDLYWLVPERWTWGAIEELLESTRGDGWFKIDHGRLTLTEKGERSLLPGRQGGHAKHYRPRPHGPSLVKPRKGRDG